MFLWLGFKGVSNCIKYSHSNIFLLSYLGYLAVGFGSVAFHMTLKCKLPGDQTPSRHIRV